MEDLQSQTSASMDWLSKFTQSTFTLQSPAQLCPKWTPIFLFLTLPLVLIWLYVQRFTGHFWARMVRTEKLLQCDRSFNPIKFSLDAIITTIHLIYHSCCIVCSFLFGRDIWMADIAELPQYHSFYLYWLHHTDMLLPRMLSCIVEICTCLKCLMAPGWKKSHTQLSKLWNGSWRNKCIVSKASDYLLHMSQALNKEATWAEMIRYS